MFFAVERHQLEHRDIDIVEATHVDGEGLVRRFGARPRENETDAAGLAEQMMDFLFAELVVRQRIVALDELELRRIDERPNRAALDADRAVAVDNLRQVADGFVAHAAAMATALIGFGIGHFGLRPCWLVYPRLRRDVRLSSA